MRTLTVKISNGMSISTMVMWTMLIAYIDLNLIFFEMPSFEVPVFWVVPMSIS